MICLLAAYALVAAALAVFSVYAFALEEEPHDRPLWIAITVSWSICWALMVPGIALTAWLESRGRR